MGRTMTESELEIFRLKARLEVHQVLLRGLYTMLANSVPGGGKAFRDRFAALREEHSKVAIQGVSPEYSDLFSGEYQEALDDALKDIESRFR